MLRRSLPLALLMLLPGCTITIDPAVLRALPLGAVVRTDPAATQLKLTIGPQRQIPIPPSDPLATR
jgi:hypothetical protein